MLARFMVMAAAVMAFASASSAMADDLIGAWEGEYTCSPPNPVGRLKLRIAAVDGKRVGHEEFSRSNNSGTVVYNVERAGPDSFRLRVDPSQAQGVSFPLTWFARLRWEAVVQIYARGYVWLRGICHDVRLCGRGEGSSGEGAQVYRSVRRFDRARLSSG